MKKLVISILFILVVLCSFNAQAQDKSLYHVVDGKYFSIYAPKNFDISEFLQKIDFDYSVRPEVFEYEANSDLRGILAKTIDSLYLEVSDIMDIHVYSFHGNMNILKNRSAVGKTFKSYFKRKMPERGFYLPERKALYVSSEDMTLGMLGHEMGHAIIGAYFVVPPPSKMQEILCGYVEYDLRKRSGSLPVKVISSKR